MATTIATDSDMEREEAINDAKLEQLLSEKLMEGYVLMEVTCPRGNCPTPLVKNHQMVPRTLSGDEGDAKSLKGNVLLPQNSFEAPFRPVDGVPYCVGCQSHVVTSAAEVAILEACETLKDKGSIYVALEELEALAEPAAQETANDNDDDLPEIIHLEDVQEEDVVGLGTHRGNHNTNPFLVDIETSLDADGMSAVEVAVSPRMGDPDKPIVIEDLQEEKKEEDDLEYSKRREIATKVLGAKMLQGWTLKEEICGDCGMPNMEKKGRVDCVVCPALAKQAKKELKAQKKLQAEQEKLAAEVRTRKELAEKAEDLEHLQSVRQEIDSRAHKDEEEATIRAEARQQAIAEEKARILALQAKDDAKFNKPETPKPAEEEEDEPSPEAQERARAVLEEERLELERLEAIAQEEEERRKLTSAAKAKEDALATEEATVKEQQQAEAAALAAEAQAIEAMDDSDDTTEAMKKDQKVEEHRQRLKDKLTLDEQVQQLEEERLREALEARRVAEERRIESESRMIAALEADAAIKALAAEDAIRRAKEALQEVTTTKKQIISQTIELAEKEALQETEETLKERFEDHTEPVVVKSDSEIYEERWETLRQEGRAIMTRRLLQGWSITSEACQGGECHQTPLIERKGKKECTVCGGSGNGKDGCFAKLDSEDEEDDAVVAPAAPPSVAAAPAPATYQEWPGAETEADFEKKRAYYAKEIGKKMLQGWQIVDASCDKCVMPLMMDDKGNTDLCLACGETQQEQHRAFDASTIATNDTPALETVAEDDDREESRPLSPVIEAKPTDESDLVSTLKKNQTKQQQQSQAAATAAPAAATSVKSADPPAFKPVFFKETPQTNAEVIPLPPKVDFADADAIRELVGGETDEQAAQGRDDTLTQDASVEIVANLFLKSPHGYDFQDFGQSMEVSEVQELVEIFLVTNVDKDVSDGFKRAVAETILSKMSGAAAREASSPPRTQPVSRPERFRFDDEDATPTRSSSAFAKPTRSKPCPETAHSPTKRALPPKSPRSRVVIEGHRSPLRYASPRSPRDDASAVSRVSSVASDALESIYDRIDQCKKKLLDPTNNLDEQIATAALLEKLAQAAVAVREMEVLE